MFSQCTCPFIIARIGVPNCQGMVYTCGLFGAFLDLSHLLFTKRYRGRSGHTCFHCCVNTDFGKQATFS